MPGKTETRSRRLSRLAAAQILLPLLAICFLVSACVLPGTSEFGTPAEIKPGDIRFNLAPPNDAAILVPVKINGQGPFTFVLDTGATFTCIDQKLVEQLKLPEWRGQFGAGTMVPTEGSARLVTMDSIEVGDATAKDLKACVIDFQRFRSVGLDAHGLVGLNFLKSYRVTIDFVKKIIHLEKKET